MDKTHISVDMRVVVLGADGMLGRYVATYLMKDSAIQVIGMTRKDLDASTCSFQSLCGVFDCLEKVDTVVNCIGVIPQSSQELIQDDLYIRVNGIFPHILAHVCEKYVKCHMIHVTTDCIYDGKYGNYDETSVACPSNIYGFSKAVGDSAPCTMIRTSIIGEENRRKTSLLEWVLSKHNTNEIVSGFVNHYWNGVTCLQLAKVIHQIVITRAFWKGIRHIYTPNPVSKYDLVCSIRDVYGLSIAINPMKTKDTIDRTLKSVHPESNGFDIPNIDVQIEEQRLFSQHIQG